MTTDDDTLRRQALNARRVASMRQRRSALGLVRLELYVHPEDKAKIKALAKTLSEARK